MQQSYSALDSIYHNPKDPGSYSGVDALLERAREDGLQVSKEQIQEYLRSQDAYTLHKPIRKRYVRNKTVVGGIDRQWQADLADMTDYGKYNEGFRYLLTVIDCFSKYAWAVPVKRKDAPHMVTCLQQLLRDAKPRKPLKLQTDKGKEFLNHQVKQLLKKHGIQHFASSSDTKASMVERFNRTLKSRMWRYFTDHNTYRFLEVLPDLLHAYNHSKHRMIGMRPVDVNSENENQVWIRLYGNGPTASKPRLEIGDTVRLSKVKTIFEKGYLPSWTTEPFTISKSLPRNPQVYKIKDNLGEEIHGSFYLPELQKVKKQNLTAVEKIIKHRRVKGVKEIFVKWKGFPKKFNSWIKESELIPINVIRS